MTRSFVAVEFAPEIRERLSQAIEKLRALRAEVKWVAPENIHMTLRFLGELQDIESVRGELDRRLSGMPAARIQIQGLGKFPEHGNDVRVVWAGVAGDVAGLKALWNQAQAAARASRLPEDDHGFSPHITLGRVKGRQGLDRLRGALEAAEAPTFGEQAVDHVTLMKSTLTPQGSIYEPLARFELKV